LALGVGVLELALWTWLGRPVSP
jgi:hypothetical protein